jgi:hypothetical protein
MRGIEILVVPFWHAWCGNKFSQWNGRSERTAGGKSIARAIFLQTTLASVSPAQDSPLVKGCSAQD